MKIIEKIDAMGGAIIAISNGYIENAIANSAYEFQKKIETGEKIIVGTNKYESDEESITELLKIDSSKVNSQIDDLVQFKFTRNNDQVKNQLNNLGLVAKTNDNLMSTIIDCVKNDCTLGEISDTLRRVFGEY